MTSKLATQNLKLPIIPDVDIFELLLLISLFAVPFFYPSFHLGLAQVRITDMATLFIAIGFIIRAAKKELQLKLTTIDLVFLALICWSALGLTKSVDLKYSLRDFFWLVDSALLLYMVEHAGLNKEQIYRLFRAGCYGAVIIGLLAVLQYYATGERAYVNLRNANHLAGYLIFYLPILIGFKYGKKLDQRYFWGILATIVSTALVVTYTRGGWYAAVIALSVMALIKDKKLLIFIVTYILIYSWIFTPVMNRAVSVVNEAETSNGQYRIQLWLTALRMFHDNPVTGVGIGNYYTLHDEYLARYPYLDRGHEARQPHNSYVKWLAETGIIGFGLIITVLMLIARNAFTFWRRTRGDPENALIISFICGAGAVMIHSATNSLFHLPRGIFGVWIAAGLVLQLARCFDTTTEFENVNNKTKSITFMKDRVLGNSSGNI